MSRSAVFKKDPQAIKDFTIDWREWLAATDILSTSNWTVDDTTMAVTQTTNTTGTATIWLASGTINTIVSVVNRITTAGGRQQDQTIYVKIYQE